MINPQDENTSSSTVFTITNGHQKNLLQTDEEIAQFIDIAQTNKELKECIEHTYNPWVFEQLKKKLPALENLNLAVTSQLLNGISLTLSSFENGHMFSLSAKENNCVSLVPFCQGDYPASVQVIDGICTALAIEWLTNQGTETENDFTETTGYNWDNKPFEFKHQKKDDVTSRAITFYAQEGTATNAEHFEVLKDQGGFFTSGGSVTSRIKDMRSLGYKYERVLPSENSKRYPVALHDAIKNLERKAKKRDDKSITELKIYDYIMIKKDMQSPATIMFHLMAHLLSLNSSIQIMVKLLFKR